MVFSRITSLILGTVLFVTIWTMQDGNHAAPQIGLASDFRPVARTSQTEQPGHIAATGLVESASTVASDEVLWIFAAEEATQIAVK